MSALVSMGRTTALLAHTMRRLWIPRAVSFICVATAVSILILRYSQAAALFNQYDDAYITFRYAVNLATGKGLVFNLGEPTDAASSFLYTLLLALCHRVGFHNLEMVSTVVGIAALAGTMLTVFASCMVRTAHLAVATFLTLLVGFNGLLSGWWATGMETCFFAFLVSAAVHRLLILRRLDWGSAILVCLTALTRLEGMLLVPIYALMVAVRWHRHGVSGRKQRSLVSPAVTVLATVLGFFALKQWLYGTPLPHAFLFKYVSNLYRSNPAQLWSAWQSMGLGVVILGGAGLFLQPSRLESWVLVGYVVISAVSLTVGPAADYGRYSVHLLPVLVVLAAIPLAAVASLMPSLALVMTLLLSVETLHSFDQMVAFNQAYSAHQSCRKQVGKFMEENLRPTSAVLSSDIGAIAYAAPSVSFIDTIALTSADILKRRSRGESVDDLLARAGDGLVADTCHGKCKTFPDYSAYTRLVDQGAWQTYVPPSSYGQSFGQADPLFGCETPDGLIFAVTRFGN